MPETKQLTPEELQQIQELQKQYNQFIFELGSIESQLQNVYKAEIDLKNEKTNIINDITKLGEREKILVESLQTKYGTGNIDPQSGIITPF
jgi:prefoldin subunit 5